MIDISEFRLTNVPSTAYYIPNFIDEHEEQAIIKEVNRAPKSKWVKLSKGNSLWFGMGKIIHMLIMVAAEKTIGIIILVFLVLAVLNTIKARASIIIFLMIDCSGVMEIISPKQPQLSVTPKDHK